MGTMYKKILCPIDFSSYSAVALKQAASLVKIFDGKLVLAHIITNPWSILYETEDKRSMHPDEVVKLVGGMIEKFADEHVPEVSYSLCVKINEHIYRSLVEYASKEHVDLIVMPTHGYTGAKRLFMGSVAENVVRHASCSVLVVRE